MWPIGAPLTADVPRFPERTPFTKSAYRVTNGVEPPELEAPSARNVPPGGAAIAAKITSDDATSVSSARAARRLTNGARGCCRWYLPDGAGGRVGVSSRLLSAGSGLKQANDRVESRPSAWGAGVSAWQRSSA